MTLVGPSAQRPRWNKSGWTLLVAVCAMLLLLDRWSVLEHFAFRYTDDDQTIMWYGAEEMAQGRFHEPRFYGQSYNTMLEGLLAVPLLWAGSAHSYALPVVATLLAVLPYLLFAALACRKGRVVQAALVLLVPIALPVEFGLVSSMPRGFVPGVALTAVGLLALFSEGLLLIGPCAFLAILGIVVNPNAAVLLVPALVLFLFRVRHDRRAWTAAVVGSIPALLLQVGAKRFYADRPEHVVHQEWPLDFEFQRITLQAMDRSLGEVTPLFWGHGAFLVLVLVASAAWCWIRGHRGASLFLCTGVILIIASLGVNKVNDGMPTVFYSWSRMFIAVPVVLAAAIALVPDLWPRWSVLPISVAAAVLFSIKVALLPSVVDREVDPAREKNLHVMRLTDLMQRCAHVDQVARQANADLIVQGWLPTKHMMNYGCPCLITGFPETVQPELDRRTWKLRELQPRMIDRILLDGFDADAFAGRLTGRIRVTEVSTDASLLLITGPPLPTGALLDSLGLGMRRF